jgi:hypothetical protein
MGKWLLPHRDAPQSGETVVGGTYITQYHSFSARGGFAGAEEGSHTEKGGKFRARAACLPEARGVPSKRDLQIREKMLEQNKNKVMGIKCDLCVSQVRVCARANTCNMCTDKHETGA